MQSERWRLTVWVVAAQQWRRRGPVAVGILAATLSGSGDPAAAAVVTTRVSVTGGGEATGGAAISPPSMSADGRLVAFASSASNLVAGDTNGVPDVFVHDRSTGATVRVSGSAGEAEADDQSTAPVISADGRFVTFQSTATNLVPGDTNASSDVFVHDRQSTATSRVSVVTGGGQGCPAAGGCVGAGGSTAPAISADGRSVVFLSEATYLATGDPSGDTNGVADVFVHDRQAATTTRVSGPTGGGQADGASGAPAISGDGRVVAFASAAANLVGGDANGASDVFVHDRQTAVTSRVSVATTGTEAVGGPSSSPALNGNGSVVAFTSSATNLVGGDTNGRADVFVHHRPAGTTTRASVASGGAQSRRGTDSAPALTGDGRFVTFDSAADDLVAGDTNGVGDAFVHDRIAVTTVRLSVAGGGMQADGASTGPRASDDGRYVAYVSEAANLVGGDTNGSPDVFVTDRLFPDPPATGYRMVAGDGGIFAFGSARFLGSTGALRLNSPIVAMAATPSGSGYWLVAGDGGIFAFGDARFAGSTGALRLNRPIVGMAATPSGNGYWLVASDGGIFAFGDARFAGSTGALRLNRPIVGMAATPSGNGYWLVASDGGIFAFGDARFLGSTGAITLNQPLVGMAVSPSGNGYWLAARDGGIFAFGDARFLGSTGAIPLNRPMVALAAAPGGTGYWLVASDGGIFAFGDARFLGSTGGSRIARPVVGMAAG